MNPLERTHCKCCSIPGLEVVKIRRKEKQHSRSSLPLQEPSTLQCVLINDVLCHQNYHCSDLQNCRTISFRKPMSRGNIHTKMFEMVRTQQAGERTTSTHFHLLKTIS